MSRPSMTSQRENKKIPRELHREPIPHVQRTTSKACRLLEINTKKRVGTLTTQFKPGNRTLCFMNDRVLKPIMQNWLGTPAPTLFDTEYENERQATKNASFSTATVSLKVDYT